MVTTKQAQVLPAKAKGKGGRPLSFDRTRALEQAMLTFWRHGYETTSISDLTDAMGISVTSLYGAFGDKKQLFLEAARQYAGDPDVISNAIRGAASSKAAARIVLTQSAIMFTGETTPRGCLLASATASGSTAAADVQAEIAGYRDHVATLLSNRISRDVDDRVLPRSTDVEGLAQFTIAVTQGLSVLARDGAPRSTLMRVVDAALGAWPSDAKSVPGSHGSHDPR
jgi:AcrR family transcriptional regulator